jgi:hypothetical protein
MYICIYITLSLYTVYIYIYILHVFSDFFITASILNEHQVVVSAHRYEIKKNKITELYLFMLIIRVCILSKNLTTED